MKMKKFLSMSLSILLSVSLMVGCSNNKPATETTPAKDTAAQTTAESSKAPEGPSWKKDTTPINLEWFLGFDWATETFDPVNNTAAKWLQEETGITITFTTGSKDKLNVLIATNSLPDIVTYDINSTERLTMENNGLLLPLDKLREQYAPDFQVVDGMMDWYRNPDGNWYAFSSYFYDVVDTEARGGWLSSHNMNYVRKDMMEQLGLKEQDFQTKDGFVNALKKFKEANLTYNGQKVMTYFGNEVPKIAEQFGLNLEDKDGKFLYYRAQPEYLEALLFLNRLYTEGLMSDEVFTMDATLRKQVVMTGTVFAGTGWGNLAGLQDLFASDNNALMMGVGLIKGDSGKEPVLQPSATGGWTGTMISKNCKSPERAIQFFAFMSQEEVLLINNFGGKDGYDLVDGRAVIKKERVDEKAADPAAFANKYTLQGGNYFSDWVVYQKYAPSNPQNAERADNIRYRTTYQDGRYYDDKIFSSVLPDGGSDLAAIKAQIDEYWTQTEPKIIMAPNAAKAEELYKEAFVKMDSMGLQSLLKDMDTKFQANKKKMGLTFAWPRNQNK